MINRMRHGDMMATATASTPSRCIRRATRRSPPTRPRSAPTSTCSRSSPSARSGASGSAAARRRFARARRRSTTRWRRWRDGRRGTSDDRRRSALRWRLRWTGSTRRSRERLLTAALSPGGDYADLFFEYRSGADYVLEDGRIRTVGRGVTLGLGVRVLQGRRDRLRVQRGSVRRAMARRRAHRGADRGRRRRRRRRSRSRPVAAAGLLSGRASRRSLVPGADKLALLARADAAARAARPAHRQGRGVARRGDPRDPGRHHRRPAGARRAAAHPLRRARDRRGRDGKRQAGSSGGGGRYGIELLRRPGQSPEAHGREAARQAIAMLDAREAPAGEMAVVLGRRRLAASCCTRRSATASRPTSTARGRRNYSGQIGKQVASTLCTVVDDGTLASSRGTINVDDEGNPGRAQRAHRERHARRLHARPAVGEALRHARRPATAAARASATCRCRA